MNKTQFGHVFLSFVQITMYQIVIENQKMFCKVLKQKLMAETAYTSTYNSGGEILLRNLKIV